MAATAPLEQIYRTVASAFDADFYRAIYQDVVLARMDPLRHYLEDGWKEGRDPAPWFSTAAYVASNPDVPGASAFHHYVTQGWREGREAQPSPWGAPYLWRAADAGRDVAWRFAPRGDPSEVLSMGVAIAPDLHQITKVIADGFDADYYLRVYPDVAATGMDPVEHFIVSGWREGRDPCAWFSIGDYLELNPDVANAGINPFFHYLAAGRDEGRPPRHHLGFRHRTISRLTPMAQRLETVMARAGAVAVGDALQLRAALLDQRTADGGLHLTFSHDDFTANVGGVQLCLQREAQALAAQEVNHLHLYPMTAWPTVRPDDCSAPVGVVWNQQRLGAFHVTDIVSALSLLQPVSGDGRRSFALHSLLGHSVVDVLALLDAARLRTGFLWLHDFTSLCAGFHLMRDDVADCGAPPAASPACRICVYGPHRQRHTEAHDRLFAALDLTVAAPSPSAYDTWRAATSAPVATAFRIHPHAGLAPRTETAPPVEGPLVVAFIGAVAVHKGWPAFEDLASRFAADPRYRFLHLGSAPAVGAKVEFHEISVTPEAPTAMREAMSRHGVDVAVLWSLCRETFSFAAYEAVAAGAYVVTHADSGNIAAFVGGDDRGLVLSDEAELMELFETGEALRLARAERRPGLYDLNYNALTVDLLGPPR